MASKRLTAHSSSNIPNLKIKAVVFTSKILKNEDHVMVMVLTMPDNSKEEIIYVENFGKLKKKYINLRIND